MEDYVKEILIASPYPFWVTMLIFVGISAFANYVIIYLKEKARRKAEEETTAKITKEIESVKDNYNKALETHKIELQKEFEHTKYITRLCHSIDNKLLYLIAECLNIEASKGIDIIDSDEKLISAVIKLSHFLNTYKTRYKSNNDIVKLAEVSFNIFIQGEVGQLPEDYVDGARYTFIQKEDKTKLLKLLSKALSYFLPEIR